MIIRPYHVFDLEALALLFTDSVHSVAASHYNSVQCAAWAPKPPDLDEWRERLAPLDTLVAEENSELAGFVSYEQNGHIEMLYCSPIYTRRGVATALYRRVELALASLGVEELFTEASLVARPFFESHGFRVTKEQNVHRRGVCFRRYAMRKFTNKRTPPGSTTSGNRNGADPNVPRQEERIKSDTRSE